MRPCLSSGRGDASSEVLGLEVSPLLTSRAARARRLVPFGFVLPLSLWFALAAASPPRWDTFSDTWVATDALGRKLPRHEEVGPPRAHKFVGIFYFLWLGRHGDAGPFDISKILGADPDALTKPDSPLWGPLHVPHHWGESIFGYYVSDDEGVLRKHAQMLSDAGVDVVLFDVTNQLTYPESYQALCRVFDQVRRDGGRPPQIAFLCPFGSPAKVVRELYQNLYGPGRYPELWFRWEGRPLLLADPDALGESEVFERRDEAAALGPGSDTLGQTFTVAQPLDSVAGCFPTWHTTNAAITLSLRREGPAGELVVRQRFEAVHDNDWLFLRPELPLPPGTYYLEASDARARIGWWSLRADGFVRGEAFANGQPAGGDRNLRIRTVDAQGDQIRRFFTFRKPQPDYFVGPQGPHQWGWLEVYPQHAFYATPGVPEEVTVGVAQNAVDGRLSVLSHPRSHGRSFSQGRQPDPAGQDFTGRNFAEQWSRAFELDPAFVFITGWNEWIAGRFDQTAPFHAVGPVNFVDQFNREYSRDIEPMKGGHSDNFYYQMIANIRRFKGVRPAPAAKPGDIRIDGDFADWAGVEPEFRDDLGDPVRRDHAGWGKGSRYVNHTGRNDLVAAKISADTGSVQFYVRTREPLTPSTDPNWMLLFLDTDQDARTGWSGYDLVVNRQPPATGRKFTTIERHAGSGYRWKAVGNVPARMGRSEIELAIPRALLGLGTGEIHLDFKWADAIEPTGEASDFTVTGDAAPNDRFNYRARIRR